MYDHAIPFGYLMVRLLELATVEPKTVRDVLERYAVSALITKEQDALLRSCGLANRMPDDWDEVDPLARYRAAGIAVVPNPEHSLTPGPAAER